MKLKNKLLQYRAEGRAILAANFYNYETLAGILLAAQELKEPVILQLSESSIQYLGLKVAANLARTGMEQFEVEGWLHLDHGSSIEIVEACLNAGFDSVMIDGSEKSFDENVQLTKEVVEMAGKYHVQVEAELGYIAKLGQDKNSAGFTSPEEALRFITDTGVDSLAVAIGSAHGFYKQSPKLDLERLGNIAAITSIPLVLHGSSGIPDDMLKEAIRRGITKVNIATDSKYAFMQDVRDHLNHSEEIDLRKIFPSATMAVKNLIIKKMNVVGLR